jgi:hypothetical protein
MLQLFHIPHSHGSPEEPVTPETSPNLALACQKEEEDRKKKQEEWRLLGEAGGWPQEMEAA